MPENRQTDEQRIISVFSILEWAEAFIVDRKTRGKRQKLLKLPPYHYDLRIA
ncbi:MAG: hypothetical protein Q8N39_06095 [Pelolinea sp.]|nr:hypothetical protein [Pelolinea sp.]